MPDDERVATLRRSPEEVEVKLRLPEAARTAIEHHPALNPPRAGAPRQRDEITTYFDTEDRVLGRAGASLRVRRSPDGALTQTLKLAPVALGAAARRGEWEWPVSSETPDPALLAETPLAGTPVAGTPATAGSLGDGTGAPAGALGPLCTTEISRTAWQVIADDGAVIEAVIDQGRIRAGRRFVPVSELELELKSGAPGALYRLALELAEAVPLAIEPASKGERGARLAGHPFRNAVKPDEVALHPAMTTGGAFCAILGAAVGHMRVNLEPAARGDTEGVHQVRVAARRLRAAIALFKPVIAPLAAERFNVELRRTGRIFGAARDWDVFVTDTLPACAGEGAAPEWLHLLSEAAATARTAAHADAARELAAPRFTQLLLGLSAWAEDVARDPPNFGKPAMARPIVETMPALLDRMLGRAAKRAKHIRRAPAPTLHALRRRLKVLRYTAEFAEALYRPKAVKAVLRPCKELQELLGEVNDAAASPALASELAATRPDLAPAVAALATWAERRGSAARTRVPKAWRALRDADPFWK